PLPACPRCSGLARPNVLMFGDWSWDPRRTVAQEGRLEVWLRSVVAGYSAGRDGLAGETGPAGGLAVIECGAGTGIPTVRMFGARLLRSAGATLVRVNVREPAGPPGVISVPLGARDALERIDARWKR